MGASEWFLLVGFGTLLLGALGSKVSQAVRAKRRWILLTGVILCIVGTALVFLDMMRGFREGLLGK